jgi:vacuolar-type H+-ATPase subunit E/Vma4
MARAEKKKQEKEVSINDTNPGKQMNALFSGIEQDMKEEAETLLSESKKEAERRKLYAQKQRESILSDAEERAAAQSQKIRSHILSGVNLEAKRRSLHVMDELYDEAVERARTRMREAVEKKGYENILLHLIVEAAIGLDAPAALVNASERERGIISSKVLNDAQERVKALTGREVRLVLSDEAPLAGQGVVLKSEDERIAYNNQIDTRMRRFASDIRKTIHDRLSGIVEESGSETGDPVSTDRGDEK